MDRVAAVTPSLTESQESVPAAQIRPQLEKLLRDRVRKCVSLLPKVLAEDDAEAVHDLRVWSRRLQQVVVTLFPSPRPAEARTIVRTLRRTRRSLGGWRDCHVVIALLTRRIRAARNPAQKHAWEMALAVARAKLQRQIRRARHKIANRKMFTLAQRVQGLIESGPIDSAQDDAHPFRVLENSVAAAYSEWREGLARAKSSADPFEIHAFRIQTKRLRYRIELLRDLGSATAKAALSSLRTLQDELGRWHDGLSFARMTAEALADPDYLVAQPVTAAAILRKLDRENARYLSRVRAVLSRIDEQPDASPLHSVVSGFRAETSPRTDRAVASELALATSNPVPES
ncbi:MAG TPA: CHAD domain-containing protein [Candidatus Binataceae bacterium]|nr:CHAD domain-containing protein [Candidatus Binataceae bacterium]